MLDARQILDTRYSMLDARCWMLDLSSCSSSSPSSMLDTRYWMFDIRSSMLDDRFFLLTSDL